MPRKRKSKPTLVIGVDLGGTNMQIGVVDSANAIIGREARKTQARDGHKKVIQRIVEGVNAACTDAGVKLAEVAAVGIAAPGAIDIPRGVVLEAPNLKWRNLPLRQIMEKHFARPVIVDNDVNGAVWAEFLMGAGRSQQHSKSTPPDSTNLPHSYCDGDVLGVWLGTGVGGGLVINGHLFYGEFFTAGEIGQTVLFPEGKKTRRTVEDFCSRTGLWRTIRLRLPQYPRSMLHEISNGNVKLTGAELLSSAYKRKDTLALEVINEAADLLGIAIANWITVLAMDTVIIGGGVTESLGAPFMQRIRASFRKNVFPPRCQKAALVMTHLENDAGLLGAALLARAAVDE